MDGQRYHLDATFDNSLQRGTPRYDYFNLDDRHIFRDHETLVLPLPPCTADKGYYYRPLSFTKAEDVENRARQALRKKQPHFVFHWRGGGLNREILTDLLNRCAAAAAERGKCVSCSVNTAQAVVQLDFTDAPAGEDPAGPAAGRGKRAVSKDRASGSNCIEPENRKKHPSCRRINLHEGCRL